MKFLKKYKLKVLKLDKYNCSFKIFIKNKFISTDIANIFRRILLSSIYGYKIKYFRINGLKHQYCYINGILEDALEISLNFKKINFILSNKSVLIKIIKKGPCCFTAKDLEIKNICRIENKKIRIFKINSKAIFVIFIKIIKGKGYVNIKKRHKNNIYLSNFFSPIQTAGYKIIKKKSYDIINYKIKTNGTICPIKAFIDSNKVLFKNFGYLRLL